MSMNFHYYLNTSSRDNFLILFSSLLTISQLGSKAGPLRLLPLNQHSESFFIINNPFIFKFIFCFSCYCKCIYFLVYCEHCKGSSIVIFCDAEPEGTAFLNLLLMPLHALSVKSAPSVWRAALLVKDNTETDYTDNIFPTKSCELSHKLVLHNGVLSFTSFKAWVNYLTLFGATRG